MSRLHKDLEDAFIDLMHKNERIIYKVCSFYVSEQSPMEDLYQEVVLNLWKSYPKFRNESQISTWIYRVALNTCITDLRQNLKFKSHIPLPPSFEIPFESENMESELKELYSLIYRLNKVERSLILLWLEEKSYQEISDITGLNVSNVGVKLKRAKEKLIKMSNQ